MKPNKNKMSRRKRDKIIKLMAGAAVAQAIRSRAKGNNYDWRLK